MTGIARVRSNAQNQTQHDAEKASVLAHLGLLNSGLIKLELAIASKEARGEATANDYALLDARVTEVKAFGRDLQRGYNNLMLAHGRRPEHFPAFWR